MRRMIISSVVFLVVILFLFSFFRTTSQDEGVFTTISQGILEGKSPYTDFFDHKPPGIYFLFLVPQTLLANSFIGVSAFLLLAASITLMFVYKISENIKKGSGLPSLFFCLLGYIFFEGYLATAEPFLVLFVLIGLYFLYKSTKSDSSVEMFLAGLFVGLALLVKQVAIFDFLALIIVLTMMKSNLSKFVAYFGGFLLPIVGCVIYILIKSDITEALNQILVLNITDYPREEITIILLWIGGAMLQSLPLWVLATFHAFKEKAQRPKDIKVLGLFVLAIFPIPFFFIRHYPHYWIQVIPFVAIMAGLGFVDLKKSYMKQAVVLFSVSSVAIFSFSQIPTNYIRWRSQNQAIEQIRQMPQKTMLAENQFIGFYFFSNKKPLNKFLYLTEITDSQNAQEKTLNDLRSKKTNLILWPADPNYAYAKEIQVYIKKHFMIIKTFPDIGMDVYSNEQ